MKGVSLSIALCVFLCASLASAQVATGIPPFGSFQGGPDVVNLANLNVHIPVPMLSKHGRGLDFNYTESYDSSIWYPQGTSGNAVWYPMGADFIGLGSGFGWRGLGQAAFGYVSVSYAMTGDTYCDDGTPGGWLISWTYHDRDGTQHPFPGTSVESLPCYDGTQYTSTLTSTTTDGSGYTVNANMGFEYTTIYPASGGSINIFNGDLNFPFLGAFKTDSNGNKISSSSNAIVDTLGQTVMTFPNSSSPIQQFVYTGPQGGNVSFVANFASYTLQTNFGCPGISEFGPGSNLLVSSISLPDGTAYSFTYEPTPGVSGAVTGRIASVTLPTGGTISYQYTGGDYNTGIFCADGSTSGLIKTTPDGQWTYVRSSAGPASTTTVTDPQSNVMVLNFQGIYETQRQLYQGAAQLSNLLGTVTTCYNGNTSNCNGTVVTLPITERSVTSQWGQSELQAQSNTFYNSYGLVTENDEYDYASGPPFTLLRKTLTSYASLGNNIVNHPSQITVKNGQGNTVAQTTYTYDQGTPTATYFTPQHVSVSGSRGNLTTISQLVNGSSSLTRTYTYFDTGNVKTATDVNNAHTTYTYGACGNSFPTQVAVSSGPSKSMTWICAGGVMTTGADWNGQSSTISYDDPYFWRPTSTTDRAGYTTYITYPSATVVDRALTFNSGNSVVEARTTVDQLGRVHVVQLRQGPGVTTYDSVETDYDSLGRPSRRTVPYTGSAGQTNSSAPATTTSYDALNRRTQTSDGGGGYVSRTYNQNDMLRTLGPAPQNENTKQSQRERDGLGRLTSVCEVTSASGSGSCGQTSPQTGYWTKYTYDVLNDLTSVSQNAQGSAQNRTYAYDGLGRLTSETNPENGPTTYTYDTDATCGTSTGDLVKRVDAVGNTICYAHDSLHRITKVSYLGPYASATPTKCFVFDSATLNGISMANTKNRLAEAYTTTSASCTGTGKITDIYFSYSVRGEVTDVYESTPHSGGYYHSSASYWANGALNTLNPLNSTALPTFTYNLDGEGRPTSVSASTGTSPILSTGYCLTNCSNAFAGQLTGITFGTYDTDTFQYDTNTGRMTQYQFSVGASPQTVTGNLRWNPNRTLQQLAITDQFNSANSQNCTYLYDDLKRIGGNATNPGVNCGTSTWQQYFSYDAFGNITKNVPSGSTGVSFQPTYDPTTNHITALPGFSCMSGNTNTCYDANGNTLKDSLHTYAWDVEGRPVTIDSVGLTYDALGRVAEQASGSSYTEILYGPSGGKLALMNGQTVSRAFIPLPAGAVAVYTAGPMLSYFRHPDWLGSSRFASTPARTMYYDTAYAPFGETYAEAGTADRSFTGEDQDTVQGSTTGLYDFMFREYAQYGRWISPDPAGRVAVKPTRPQTWNRYAYVCNNPLKRIDTRGLEHEAGDEDDSGGDDSGGDDSSGDDSSGDDNSGDDNSGDDANGDAIPANAACVTGALEEVIKAGEGTSGPNGYGLLVYGTVRSAPGFPNLVGKTGTLRNPIVIDPNTLSGFPNIAVQTPWGISHAFGAFQFLPGTWAQYGGGSNISPSAQDDVAATAIQSLGALDAAMSGDFQDAIWDLNRTWASLPDSPYGQPTISWDQASRIYQNAFTYLPECQTADGSMSPP
jgi:RHS repeat-associated protein